MKTAYVAKDGTVCKTEQECKSHEEALDIFESVYTTRLSRMSQLSNDVKTSVMILVRNAPFMQFPISTSSLSGRSLGGLRMCR